MNNINISNYSNSIIKNGFYSLINYLVSIILQLILRYIFVYYFSVEFLGLNSLFTSLLFIFSIADLGFSNGLTFFLYEPLFTKNYPKLVSLFDFFLKVYKVIAASLFIIGILFAPFLNNIIDENFKTLNVYVIYLEF